MFAGALLRGTEESSRAAVASLLDSAPAANPLEEWSAFVTSPTLAASGLTPEEIDAAAAQIRPAADPWVWS